MENLTHKDLDMRECIIVDTDGTIADCEHRRHYLETKNWPGFFGDMHLDTVIEHTRIVVEALRAAGYAIVVVTARPDDADYKQKTINWYADNDIAYDAIYMRQGGDYRKDSIVKLEILNQLMRDGFMPVMALDDRQQVVEMWRKAGIPCLQVNDGDFDNEDGKGLRKQYVGQHLFHMLVGPSGAGKSTFLAEQVTKGVYKEHQIISSDKVRDELFGGHEEGQGHDSADLARTWRYIHKLIGTRLSEGVFTVLDATNIKRKDRMEMLKHVPKGIMVTYILIDREYDEKLKTRGWRPEKLISKHHMQFKQGLKDALKGDDQPYVVVQDKRQHKV